MTNETIKSVKEALELCSSKVSAIEVYYDFSSSVQAHGIHTDTIRSVVAEFSDLPDYMPVERFEVMDEEEYSSTVDANCDHVPFSDYLDDSDGKILVVVLPHDWEEYMKYTLYCQPAAMPDVPCPCGLGTQINWDEAKQLAVGKQDEIIDQLFGISNKFLNTDYIAEEFLDGVNYDKVERCEHDIVAIMNVGDKDYFVIPYYYIYTNKISNLWLKADRGYQNYPIL